jgi:hypothetical protein
MKRIHITLVAVLLASVAILGTRAITSTSGLGQQAKSATTVSTPELDKRSRILDRTEQELARALAERPPALPKLPSPSAAGVALPAQQVQYVRAAPIIRRVARPGGGEGDDRNENERGGGD